MTDEEKLEDIDKIADTLLDEADTENVGRIAHKILKTFAGQPRADCWVAFAYAMAYSTEDGSHGAAAGILLGVVCIFQRLQNDEDDNED